ncbi:MAG: hypothetical protein AD742_00040 [Methylibium sp. NZG]|nr:MAG: hypothetical protein AD742_00040 [Methylibium sp. NZG]
MKVLFESRDPQAAELRELAERRTSFVMRRLGWLVPSARVQMSDVNGPRGGVDKRCQVELKTESAGTVVITSLARDWRSALDSALMRAARALVRMWRRGRQRDQAQRAPRNAPALTLRQHRALAWNTKDVS